MITLKRKYLRIFIVTTVLLLIISTGALFLLHAYLPEVISERIREELKQQLNPTTDELYEFQINEVKFSTFFTTISIPGILLYPPENFLKDDPHKFPLQIYKAEISDLKASFFPFLFLAAGMKNVNFKMVQAESIFLRIYTNTHGKEISDKNADNNNIESLGFERVRIGEIKIEQLALSDTSQILFDASQIQLLGRIILPGTENLVSENIQMEEYHLAISSTGFSNSRSLFLFQTDTVSINGNEGIISVSRAKMVPRHSKQEFHKHIKFEAERIEAYIERIELDGFNINRAISEEVIAFSKITLGGGEVDVLRDRRPPFNDEQRPAMPSRMISELPVGLLIREININKTDVFYSEVLDNSDASGVSEITGKIPFERLEVTISNLSNLADSLDSDSIMHISAQADIFENTRLKSEFKYNLKDINGGYSASGELTTLDFEVINPVLYPITGIKVKEGIHKNSKFYFSGNDIESSGELYMTWTDLLLDITPDAGGFISSITRFAGKNLYHSDRIDNADDPSGEIEFDRDVTRFAFHYWWNCYLSGIKNSVLRDHVPL